MVRLYFSRDRVNNRHDAPEPAREPRSGSVTSRTSREAAAAAAAAGSRDEPSSETTALKVCSLLMDSIAATVATFS